MTLIQSAAISEQLRRLLDLRGGSPTLELLEQIVPTVIVGDLRDSAPRNPPRVASGAGEQPAVAAQFAYFVLDNPAGSGFDFLIHRVSVAGGAAIRFSVGWHAPGLATPTLHPRKFIDSQFSSGNPVAGVYSGSAAAVPGILIWDQIIRLTNDDRDHGWNRPPIMRPGTFFVVLSNTLNTNMFCAIEWEEQPIA